MQDTVRSRPGDKRQTAAVGVAEHGNSAILVTVTSEGELLDRRKVNLTEDLPTHPYHHEGAWAVGRYKDSPWAKDITLAEAIELIEQVHEAAAIGACECLEALADEISAAICRIAIRECPELPPTIEERIKDNRAQTVADTVMYRMALAAAAEARGWDVYWYDRDRVFDEAERALDSEDINAEVQAMGRSIGPPWQAKHKLAAAAAISSMSGLRQFRP